MRQRRKEAFDVRLVVNVYATFETQICLNCNYNVHNKVRTANLQPCEPTNSSRLESNLLKKLKTLKLPD